MRVWPFKKNGKMSKTKSHICSTNSTLIWHTLWFKRKSQLLLIRLYMSIFLIFPLKFLHQELSFIFERGQKNWKIQKKISLSLFFIRLLLSCLIRQEMGSKVFIKLFVKGTKSKNIKGTTCFSISLIPYSIPFQLPNTCDAITFFQI